MIQRKVRVELGKYNSEWSKSFIVLKTLGFGDSNKFQTEFGKLSRQGIKSDRELERVGNKIRSEVLMGNDLSEELEKREAKLVAECDSISQKILNAYSKLLMDSFLSGSIYDSESGQQREMVKEDLLQFDEEITDTLTQTVLNRLPKKA